MSDGRFDYLTAYMIVSFSCPTRGIQHVTNAGLQLFGIFAGIFACGVPVYFLNPKVSLTFPVATDVLLIVDPVARAREPKAAMMNKISIYAVKPRAFGFGRKCSLIMSVQDLFPRSESIDRYQHQQSR